MFERYTAVAVEVGRMDVDRGYMAFLLVWTSNKYYRIGQFCAISDPIFQVFYLPMEEESEREKNEHRKQLYLMNFFEHINQPTLYHGHNKNKNSNNNNNLYHLNLIRFCRSFA